MLIEFSKEDIEIISECILSEMSRKGNQAGITLEFNVARKKLLDRLQAINSYLCSQLASYHWKNKQKSHTQNRKEKSL